MWVSVLPNGSVLREEVERKFKRGVWSCRSQFEDLLKV